MKVEVVMPKMGESVNEGTIIKWHKKVGDKVDKDEIIFEISTDKVDTEIPSPASGLLADIKVFEQETVPVGTVVALIETDVSQKIEPAQTQPTTQYEKQSSDLVDFVMPKMGESVTQGTIIKWHKKVGDKVAKDETLFEISTDKVDTEVPSPVEGVLTEILVKEQETVDVGVVVARISPTGYVLKISKEEKTQPVSEKPVEESVSNKTQQSFVQIETKTTKPQQEKSRFYSPLVLNIARQEGISMEELETIEGTGIGGRVTKKDLLNYIASGRKQKDRVEKIEKPVEVTSFEKEPEVRFEPGEKVKIEPMDHMRQLIMEHMVKSRDTSVHVVGVQEIDMTRIHNYIRKNKEAFKQREGINLTYLPFIVDATVKALKEFPYVNSSIDGKNVVLKNYINIGIAVALEPMGLIVPVIKNADEKNITGLAKAIYDLATRARAKKLLPDEVKDSTFTITNYGLYGTLFGNPIINQPEVAILGVGAVTKKPVVVEVDGQDTIAIRHMMYISLCHDHRLIDGALAGKFMRRIKELLENFEGE